jgi:hypothetical protein
MRRILPKVVLAAALLMTGAAAADAKLAPLVEQLEQGKDFRVRVQAALELGKLKNAEARDPLLRALDDKNESVRVAAAAALKTLGDASATVVLKEYRLDRSHALRRQVNETILALEAGGAVGGPAKLFVRLGSLKNGTHVKSKNVDRAFKDASREKLSALPGISVLEENEAIPSGAKQRKLPVVMLTGRVQRLKVSREGSDLVYSAKVEYILHKMPQQSIAATLSGSASARTTVIEARDKQRAAQLRQAVLDAAVASAIRRASEALLAAAK